jgi:outer membrane murein-binding lipoprotein Lpp
MAAKSQADTATKFNDLISANHGLAAKMADLAVDMDRTVTENGRIATEMERLASQMADLADASERIAKQREAMLRRTTMKDAREDSIPRERRR